MNILDELNHRLSSKSRIRSLFKDASVSELEKILGRLQDIHAEKLSSKEAEEEKRKKKMNDIAAIQQVMAERGLSLADFDAKDPSKKGSRKRRKVSKYTFEYQTASGDSVRWHGSTTGRVPKAFQDYLERSGKKRADCIVD